MLVLVLIMINISTICMNIGIRLSVLVSVLIINTICINVGIGLVYDQYQYSIMYNMVEGISKVWNESILVLDYHYWYQS